MITADAPHVSGLTAPSPGNAFRPQALKPDDPGCNAVAAPAAAATGGWLARLTLGYSVRHDRTVLSQRAHSGPLRVQRDLYPEGPGLCHTIVVHPPGGIAGGDDLTLAVSLEEASAVLLTTPGAAKWYRSDGRKARQTLQFEIADHASLEWLPQESIVFSGARAETAVRIELSGDATYLGWDIVCLGRREAGERFCRGDFAQRVEVLRDGARLWNEYARVEGGDPLLYSPVGLAGRTVCGTLLAAGREVSREAIADCRQIPIVDEAIAGVTRLPGMLVARYLGDDNEDAKHYFAEIWRLLRPDFNGRTARSPRIWAT